MSPAELTAEVSGVLADTGELLTELVGSSSAASHTDAALPSLFRAFDSLRHRATQEDCTVAVLAQCKSGEQL